MMESYLDIAVEIAHEAGALLLQFSQQPLEISYKRRSDLVTEADRRSEALIVERLRARFPKHGIVAEEGGGQQTDSEYCWYVDPLDGTTNFAHGFPVYCVTLGLACRGEVVAGVANPGRAALSNAEQFLSPQAAAQLRALLAEARTAVGQIGMATESGSHEAIGAVMELRKVLQRLDLLLGTDDAATTLRAARDASRNLAQVTATLERTTTSLDSILAKINSGRGSIGRMVNDTTLAADLHAATTALTELLTDLKANPSKYIHVRIF